MLVTSRKSLPGAAAIPVVALMLAGCASVGSGPVIKTGDQVGVHLTCRLPNGELAVSTSKAVADDRSLAKSSIFLPVTNDDPITVVAGGKDEDKGVSSPGFEDEILRRIAQAAVGMREGEKGSLTLTAEKSLLREGEQQQLDLIRNQRRPKELRIPRDEYRQKLKIEPETGHEFAVDRGFTGKITSVTEKEVMVTVAAVPGTVVTTALGKGTIRDKGDHFEIELQVKVGDLIRSGGLVGRVSQVDADKFTIDYSNPFGGQSLDCTFSTFGVSKTPEQAGEGAAAKSETTAAPASEAKTSTPTDQPIDPAQMARIRSAVTDALQSGKSSLDLDLSALTGPAAKDDLVTVRFQASNPDGTPLVLPEGSAKQNVPQELMAGKDELFPGIGAAVLGMAPGEKKQITLAPEKAFGPRDESKSAKFPLKNTVPASLALSAEEFVKRFGAFPVAGKEVPFIPYLTAKVERVGEKEVTLAISATDGARFGEPYGTITTAVGPQGVTLTLIPKLGASIPGEHPGVITASDAETFTVDANHPLAGKTITLDLELISLTKAASLQGKPVDWVGEHDAGLARAKKEGKPVFLILYADWCGWCKKTLTETIPDPRLNALKDKFVWVKVNSDKETKYKQQYGQNGYPLMLVLNPDGTLRKRIDGYRDARALKEELDGVL